MPDNLIDFNKEKCNTCGLCVKVCVDKIITQSNNKMPKVTNAENCNKCGHCVAVCPKDAITHNKMNMENFKEIKYSEYNPDLIEDFLSSKRSIRNFTDKSLDKKTIERLIKVASMAPTAENGQYRGYVVVTDNEKLKEIEKDLIKGLETLVPILNFALGNIGKIFVRDKESQQFLNFVKNNAIIAIEEYKKGDSSLFHNAPCLIVLYSWRDEGISGDKFAKEHIGLAESYLTLQAHSMGLASFIVGYASSQPKILEKHISIPKGYKIYSAVLLGYPKIKFKKTVDRKPAEVKWYS